MKERSVLHTIRALETSDGAGVRLKRALGHNPSVRLDPFLMLDAFSSDNPDDYIGGFPAHPHRGFETVTYLLAGHMCHRDSFGHAGELRAGDVQWMTAGSGLVHSEMPHPDFAASGGTMHGFQLWVNLPRDRKMMAPRYQEIAAADIPRAESADGPTAHQPTARPPSYASSPGGGPAATSSRNACRLAAPFCAL